MPKYFASKESFGDADFLCCVPEHFNVDIKKFIMDEFNSKEIFQNTTVYSFEFNELQVDMILMNEDNWVTANSYYSWNDCNNLIGKCAHKFGLKHGYTGLVYPYRIDGKMLGNILVSKDIPKILEFCGFDAKQYEQGFDSLEEIFDFVTSSKYFNPWMYDLENLNKINRDRDKKRSTYTAFVKHVAPLKEKGKDYYHYFYPDKKVYLGYIDHHFPGFLKKYRELEIREERLRSVNKLYNGDLIMQHFDLKGKELGAAMSKFQASYASKEALENFILEANDTTYILHIFGDVNNLEYKQ